MGWFTKTKPKPGAGPALKQTQTFKFQAIRDKFSSVEEVQQELRKNGLESSQLIVGIDFTKSNEWAGKRSFGGVSLHAVGEALNPYEEATSIIGRTLAAFDDDHLIPCYGFGDSSTGDRAVFSFFEGDRPANGLEEVLWRYRHISPHVNLSGPTTFAPLIHQAMSIVMRSMQYHILLIIADGQVTRSVDVPPGVLSMQEKATVDAIVAASYLPLSIIMVGVGDGPWDMMREFDDALPARQFDNFQFVNFTDLMQETYGVAPQRRDALFALRSLMEIPDQYRSILRLGLLGSQPPNFSIPLNQPPLPPPPSVRALDSGGAGAPPMQAPQASFRGYGSSAPPNPPPARGNSMFICPITQDVMNEPVVAGDGHTYEKVEIEKWLQTHNTSPMTQLPMPHTFLTPNYALQSAIQEWRTSGRDPMR